jgi:hypothetical protein
LRDFRKQVAKQLNQLEREVEKAARPARRRAVKLLREASRELGRLEAHGERGWRQLAAPYRKELAGLVKRIEKAVAPKRAPRKKSGTRKTSGARKKVAAKAPAKAEPTKAEA